MNRLMRRRPAPVAPPVIPTVVPVVVPTPEEEPTTTRSGLPIVDSDVWGPPLWFVLHTMAAAGAGASLVPVLQALDGSLPCPVCEEHYHAWLESHPVSAETNMVEWLTELHNQVNIRNESGTWTVADVVARYVAIPETAGLVSEALAHLDGVLGAAGMTALRSVALTIPEDAPPVPDVAV